MKRALSLLLALFVLLGASAAADSGLDTAQLADPFPFSFDDYAATVRFWEGSIFSQHQSDWSDAEPVENGFELRHYEYQDSVEVAALVKDGQVYALTVGTVDGALFSEFAQRGSDFGSETALLLISAMTVGIRDDNVQDYAGTISNLNFTTLIQPVTDGLQEIMTLSSMELAAPQIDRSIAVELPIGAATLHMHVDTEDLSLRFLIAFTPSEYSFD